MTFKLDIYGRVFRMARIDKLEEYEDQIQIVIQRLHIDIPKLKRLLKWNSNANHRKTALYD